MAVRDIDWQHRCGKRESEGGGGDYAQHSVSVWTLSGLKRDLTVEPVLGDPIVFDAQLVTSAKNGKQQINMLRSYMHDYTIFFIC